jgi:molybdopterin-guanine dinucleotide biosynthesis protein A
MISQKVTGIVLAGGKSTRMGCNKALLIYRGRPLVQHAIDMLMLVCENVVISANKDDYKFTGCQTWPDEIPEQAPMVGIYSCLKRSPNDRNIFLTCDIPLVDPRLFELLLSAGDEFDMVIPIHDAHYMEPLCGIYHKRVIGDLERSISNREFSLQDFIRKSKHKLIEITPDVEFYRKDMFLNINTAEDFDLLS